VQPAAPVSIQYQVDQPSAGLTASQLAGARIALWTGSSWLGLPCQASGTTLSCTAGHLSTFGVVLVPAPVEPLDNELPNGHFFRQANSFGGATSAGFAVVDDEAARFWSDFQALGGVERVGYPISNRFMFRGFLTQAFQRLALQWRPDLGRAVPINTLDELQQRPGLDSWLDRVYQVPPAADTAADTGLDFAAVVARHVAMLDAYPQLAQFYASEPDAQNVFGLPLAVKDYGGVVSVRLQRATLQLWPGDNGPSVTIGNGSDLAKAAGLWPLPEAAPTVSP
jgi:hypothetical protein